MHTKFSPIRRNDRYMISMERKVFRAAAAVPVVWIQVISSRNSLAGVVDLAVDSAASEEVVVVVVVDPEVHRRAKISNMHSK